MAEAPLLRGNGREGREHLALVIDLDAYRSRRLSFPQLDPDAELARLFAHVRRDEFRLVPTDGPEAA